MQDESYCQICRIKFGSKDKEAIKIILVNQSYVVHSGCARNFFGVMKKYSKNKRNWLVFSKKKPRRSRTPKQPNKTPQNRSDSNPLRWLP